VILLKSYGKYSSLDLHLQHKGIFAQYQKKGIDGNGKLHQHLGYEIYLFHEGKTTFIVGDHVYSLQSGDMIFIPGQIPHISRPDPDSPYIRSVVHFMDTHIDIFPYKLLEPVLKLFPQNGLLIHWSLSERCEIEKLVSGMEAELRKNGFAAETMTAALLFELLVIAYRKVGDSFNQTVYKQLTQRELYVEQILSIINRSYKEDIDLDYLSNCININKHYMCHCFKDVTGYTISAYIQHKRMEEAKKLLQFSLKPVSYIGQCVGIGNVSHFSRRFKEYSGMTPSAYRKKYQAISGKNGSTLEKLI
jgi:AraC-like DNA-binding protein